MSHAKTFLIAGLTTAVFVAVIFRVKPLRNLVTGMA